MKTKPSIDIGKSKILVTGGSGSLGRSIIKRLLKKGAKNIVSISRDEELIRRAENEIESPFVSFKLGDITDKESVDDLMKGVDVVFHAAAVKHVSLAEKNPREAHRVNVMGLLNILNASRAIKRFVHISSDKAIGVINCYGATKLLGEYLVRESNQIYQRDIYLIARCPNLLGSRGSVLEAWHQQLKKNNKIKISDPEMTRYFITLNDAAEFIVDIGLSNKPDVQKMYYPLRYTKKFKLEDLATAFLRVNGKGESKIEVTGASPGEKKHEDYISDVPLCGVTELVALIKNI